VALQNVQARLRMVLTYLLAQLLPWARARGAGRRAAPRPLLVLGSANVDEALRGYLTKYDCSAADVNPIGGVAKADLAAFLHWAARPVAAGGLGYPSLADVAAAAPTAELEPVPDAPAGGAGDGGDGSGGDGGGGGGAAAAAAAAPARQTDEADMGCTYAELGAFGRLRSLGRCGPVAMFRRAYAMAVAGGRAGVSGGAGVDGAGGGGGFVAAPTAAAVAARVRFFWRAYSANRHKMTTLTPAYHAEGYSPEDNRFDLRPFLYNVRWPWQFARMDELVAEATAAEEAAAAAAEEEAAAAAEEEAAAAAEEEAAAAAEGRACAGSGGGGGTQNGVP